MSFLDKKMEESCNAESYKIVSDAIVEYKKTDEYIFFKCMEKIDAAAKNGAYEVFIDGDLIFIITKVVKDYLVNTLHFKVEDGMNGYKITWN